MNGGTAIDGSWETGQRVLQLVEAHILNVGGHAQAFGED